MQGKFCVSILSLLKILFTTKTFFVLIQIFVYCHVLYWAQKRKWKLIMQNENMLFDSGRHNSYFAGGGEELRGLTYWF